MRKYVLNKTHTFEIFDIKYFFNHILNTKIENTLHHLYTNTQ